MPNSVPLPAPPLAPADAVLLSDRLAMRERPTGTPLLRQQWSELLFLHWPVPAELVQPHLPPRLQIDIHDGMAWLAVVPFEMSKVRTRFTPPVPGADVFLELNVRTYVHLDGVPGVWFFSLDATNALAVWVARTFFNLPYLRADMRMESPAPIYGSSRPSAPTAEPHPPASAPPGKSERRCRLPSPARWRFSSPSGIASTPATRPKPSSTGAGWRTRPGPCAPPRCCTWSRP